MAGLSESGVMHTLKGALLRERALEISRGPLVAARVDGRTERRRARQHTSLR